MKNENDTYWAIALLNQV